MIILGLLWSLVWKAHQNLPVQPGSAHLGVPPAWIRAQGGGTDPTHLHGKGAGRSWSCKLYLMAVIKPLSASSLLSAEIPRAIYLSQKSCLWLGANISTCSSPICWISSSLKPGLEEMFECFESESFHHWKFSLTERERFWVMGNFLSN